MKIHNPEGRRPTMHRVEPENIFLFHGKGGSPGGSVLQLEELLRARFPRTRFVRPALLHGDPEVTAEASLERLLNLEIPNGSAVIGISLGGLVAATRVVWGEALEGSSRSILAKVEGDVKEDGEKLRAAKQFLIEMLTNGSAPAKELLKYAREGYGISEDTLRRAYKEIGTKQQT